MHAATLVEEECDHNPSDNKDDSSKQDNKLRDNSDDEDSIDVSFTYAQTNGLETSDCDPYSILLDMGSNCSMFNNPDFLTDIHDSESTLRVYTNGSYQESTQKGMLPGFFEVWFNKESMVNILSFSDVAKKICITMDTLKQTRCIAIL